MNPTIRRTEMLAGIASTCPELGDDELEIVYHTATRLRGGQQTYGVLVLDSDPRDDSLEAAMELVDACQYLTRRVMRRLRRR